MALELFKICDIWCRLLVDGPATARLYIGLRGQTCIHTPSSSALSQSWLLYSIYLLSVQIRPSYQPHVCQQSGPFRFHFVALSASGTIQAIVPVNNWFLFIRCKLGTGPRAPWSSQWRNCAARTTLNIY